MGKSIFLAGAGVGYVLGTRAGREQYDKIQQLARTAADRPEVQQAVEKAAPLAEKVAAVTAQKIPGIGGGKAEETSAATSSTTGTAGSNVDQSAAEDIHARKAAAEKPAAEKTPADKIHTEKIAAEKSPPEKSPGERINAERINAERIPAPGGGRAAAEDAGARSTTGTTSTRGGTAARTPASGAGSSEISSDEHSNLPPRGTFDPVRGTF